MRAVIATCRTAGLCLALAGCGEREIAPPEVVFGEDPCARCQMILNDERYAGAILVEDADGRRHDELFDDLNCLVEFEAELEGGKVVARWVRDASTRTWIHAESAFYVSSPDLHTPMASGVAAFAERGSAEAEQSRSGGDLIDFAAVRVRFTPQPRPAAPAADREGPSS